MSDICRGRQDAIADFVSGTLEPEQTGALGAHLEVCPVCRAYAQALRREDGQLTAFFERMDGALAQAKDRAMAAIRNAGPGADVRVARSSRAILSSRTAKGLAAAAAVAIVVFGATLLRPALPNGEPASAPWWQGSAAAWAQEIRAALERITIEALVYRQRAILVGADGTTHLSGSWRQRYQAGDRSRDDVYYEDTLVGTDWTVPEGRDLARYSLSHEYECYTVRREEAGAYLRDPVDRLRFHVGLMGEADRLLGTETIEGRECVGFAISAAKYGDNPAERVDHIWFDAETRLPVRIELHGRPITDHPDETISFIQDQFEYGVELTAETFVPEIPPGFVNAHPDDIRAAREGK